MYPSKGCRIAHKIRLTIFLLLIQSIVPAQVFTINKKHFFSDEKIVEMTLVTDLKKLTAEKNRRQTVPGFQTAGISCVFADSITITTSVEIRPRGEFRREECGMPPLMVNFKHDTSNTFKTLGKLKLVWPCENSGYYEQLVLKEYLVYKIYNLLTDKSFRVRLLKLTTHDSCERYKPSRYLAFFIEDVDAMSKRNNCREMDSGKVNTEQTNRAQATLVGLFQYMIGNTDWAVPLNRNVKLLLDKTDSLSAPYIVPYDFDYCGLVNADYAVPVPELEIASVRDRLYRGFPRTMEELQATLQLFRDKKNAIYSLITNMEALSDYHRDDMIQYLDGFFLTINNEKKVKQIFIDHARKK